MKSFLQTLRVIRALVRASLALALQYRLEFFVGGGLALFWQAVTLVPLWVVFGKRGSVAGWTFPEALLVIGWFTALKAFLEGAVSPSLMAVIEHVRKGTLDFVLIKPVDAQVLVSFAKVEPARSIDLIGATAIFLYAFRQLGHTPHWTQWLTALAMLLAALLVLYSIAIVVVSIAFVAVRVDNLMFLFQSTFDAARWPSSVFRGFFAVLFTFVLPLALMTTYPALALLGRLSLFTALGAAAGSIAFAAMARIAWRLSMARYTSASS